MHKHINIRIKQAIAKEMMIGFVFYTNTVEVVAALEVVKNVDSLLVIHIDIRVSTDKD